MSRLPSPQPDPAPAADPSLHADPGTPAPSEETDVTMLDSRHPAPLPPAAQVGEGRAVGGTARGPAGLSVGAGRSRGGQQPGSARPS
jgi:hypothetical protein